MSDAQHQPTAKSRRLETVGRLLLAIAVVFGVSYCAEFPKYQFEKDGFQAATEMPGARLIITRKSGDLASPVSWVWPATTLWTYAIPDPLMRDRFILVMLIYGEKTTSFLIDADCKQRTIINWYALDQPTTANPAIGVFGEPVETRDGRIYRVFHPKTSLPANDLHALCDTDWTAERKAVQSMP